LRKNIISHEIDYIKMEKFKYVIIDDEYPSHLTVQHHFRAYPNYVCMATFFDPKSALLFLQTHEVNLIFLDISMPEMDGFQFLEALKKNIFVVIITAYFDKYSHDAHPYYMNNDLVFFANKVQLPYYFPKIIACFEKKHVEKEMVNRIHQLSKNEIRIFPKMINNVPIPLADILFITVVKHNIVLQMNDGEEIVDRMSLCELIKILPTNTFLQIRRDIIINIVYVTAFTDTTVCLEDYHFRISARKQKEVVQILKTKMHKLCENY